MKTRTQAEAEARKTVNRWATTQAFTGWIPGSTLVFTGTDLVMINQVAAAFGVETFDPKNVAASVGGVVSSSLAANVIAEGVGIVPIFGWAVKSAMMGGKAKAIGEAVIAYFRDQSPLPRG
jgi:uncharacterized protein (DUF697 family)